MFIIIIFAIMVFSLTSIYHVSGDACWHLSASRFIAEEQKIPLNEGLGRNEPFWAPPLFHVLSASVYSISNNSIGPVKFISPVFAVFTLILSFLVIRKLFADRIAFYSLLFLSFIPLFIDYSVFSYVESTLVFFVILSVYLALKNRPVLAAIAAGLGILAKYNAVFIIPLLIYIFYKNSSDTRSLIKRTLTVILLPLAIASPWLIRNWVVLGNPIWPFLNFIFNGVPKASYTGFHVSRLVDIRLLIQTYLGFFGVPDGNPQNLFFFDIPLFKILIGVWLIGTLIFVLPLIYSFFIKKIRFGHMLLIWIILYSFLFLLYVPNVGYGVTRIILPALAPLAILWAIGLDKMLNLNLKYKKVIMIFLVLIMVGFVFTEYLKLTLAANEWEFYEGDFEWVRSNTGKNAVFLAGGQCVPFNIHRISLSPDTNTLSNVDYAFTNQNFKLDQRLVLDKRLLDQVKSLSDIAYKNEKTGTVVYKIRK